MRTPELRPWRHSGVFIANFEQISQRINKIYYNTIYFKAFSHVSVVNLVFITSENHLLKECFNIEAVIFCIQKNSFPYLLFAKVDIY